MSTEVLTGCSFGEKTPPPVFPGGTAPDESWLDGFTEFVKDRSEVVEFDNDWLEELDNMCSDVFKLLMDSLALINIVADW